MKNFRIIIFYFNCIIIKNFFSNITLVLTDDTKFLSKYVTLSNMFLIEIQQATKFDSFVKTDQLYSRL